MEQTTILKIKDNVDKVDLNQVMQIAESVADVFPIPGIDYILKIMRILVRLKPAASSGLSAAANFMGKGQPIEREMSQDEIAERLEEMVNLALVDGVLTADEERVLMDAAAEYGLDPNEFIAVVRDRCNQENEW